MLYNILVEPLFFDNISIIETKPMVSKIINKDIKDIIYYKREQNVIYVVLVEHEKFVYYYLYRMTKMDTLLHLL